MIPSHDTSDSLAPILARVRAEDVSDLELARLRRRVQQAVAVERRKAHARSLFARLASAAAVLVMGALSTLLLVQQGGSSAPSHFAVTRADDGAVVIQFANGKSTHLVTKSTSPVPGTDVVVDVARGRRFVDKSEQEPAPGTVVFYRID